VYDTFTLDVDQASELKHAAKRNGATNADLKTLSSGDNFAKILPFLRGRAKIVITSVFQVLATVNIEPQEAVTVSPEYFKSAKVRNFFTKNSDDWHGIEVPQILEREIVVRSVEQKTSNKEILQELGESVGLNFSEMRGFLLWSLEHHTVYNSSHTVNFYMRNKHGERRLIHAQMHAGAGDWSLHEGGTGGTCIGDVWISRK